jgi:hypothetical protein
LIDDDEARTLRVRERVLRLYIAATILLLLGLGVLVVYSIRLGTIVGPGVTQSFGFAVALAFLMAALLAHLLDSLYRVWPLGRRVHPTMPPPFTDRTYANVLAIAILVAVGGAIAYLLAGVLP